MPDQTRIIDTLQLEQVLPFQEKHWRAQRIGWAVMLLIVLLALAGLLGPGPLSERRAEQNGITLSYRSLVHHGNLELVQLDFSGRPSQTPHLEVTVTSDYIKAVEFARIQPEPVRSEAAEGRLKFVFAVAPGSHHGSLFFQFTPIHYGIMQGYWTIGDGKPFLVRQFVYP